MMTPREVVTPDAAGLDQAKTAFFVDEPVDPGVVREPILSSWKRSRLRHVPHGRLEVPFDADVDADTALTRAADPVLGDVLDHLLSEPVSVLLCNARGTVLQRHTADRLLEKHLDRIYLAPGFSYAEEHVGTNGIGTALEAQAPAQVFGHEHYVEHLEGLACAGIPVVSPATGKLHGVLNLTCWRRDARHTLSSTAASVAGKITEVLVEQSSRREFALLNDYLAMCRRSRGAVIAVGHNLLMLNDRARELLGPGDQAPLLAEALDALSGGGGQLVVDLPSGLTVRVVCRPSSGDRSDGVLTVARVGDARVQTRPAADHPLPALPELVGSSLAWTRCWKTVDQHCVQRQWVVLEGEAGTGKAALVRASHRSRTPASHLRVLDALDAGPAPCTDWLAEVAEELQGEGTLVLSHVDRLPESAAAALADTLEPLCESTTPGRTWVVLTVAAGAAADPRLVPLMSCFPRTVIVPPLRHHAEDIAELVPYLLSRLHRGRDLSCSPDALGVLMRNRWPGNVEQLLQVLHKVTATLRSGTIEVHDLSPEVRASRRHILSPLEAIECDAIIDALAQAGGNKAEAARSLGMSRATIYRKIRGFGISEPAG
jgi:sigma-54 dependent transcriptional regulator, acetoin dehydrogenase operon transcriptional activator AcoR